MTVAFDAEFGPNTGTGTISWTHTPVGTPKAVIVGIAHTGLTDEISTAPTYGGVSLTEMSDSPTFFDATEDAITYAYFLGSSIPTGAQTVEVTVSGATDKACFSVTLTAADDTEIVDTAPIAQSSANPSATLLLAGRTSFAGEILASGQGNPGSVVPLTNWTDRGEYDIGSQVFALYTYDTIGNSDVTAGWSNTSTDESAAVTFAISEVISAGFPIHLSLLGVGA